MRTKTKVKHLTQEAPLNEDLVNVTPIDGTPFTAVKAGDKYFLALGKYRISDLKDNAREVIEESTNTTWGMIMSVIQIMILEHESEKVKEQKI